MPESEAQKTPVLAPVENAAQVLANAPKPPSSFTLKTSTPAYWRNIIASVHSLDLAEPSFKVTPEGLVLRAMDPSHVALIDLKWEPKGFAKYEADGAQTFNIALEQLQKVISRADSSDSVEIIRAGSDALTIRLGANRQFDLHLLDPSTRETPLPKLTYTTHFDIKSATFASAFADIGAVSNHITIDANKEQVIFSGKGDTGKAQAALSAVDKRTDITFDPSSEDARATYSLEYLTKIVKAAGTEWVHVDYASKMPMRLELKPTDSLLMYFYLAPRVME